MFRDVIARTPDFAPAYSSLAQLNNVVHIVLPGVHRNAQRTAQALEYAREAVRLDPIDSRSQLSLAWSHAMSNQHEQARSEERRVGKEGKSRGKAEYCIARETTE